MATTTPTATTTSDVWIGHKAAIDALPFQLEPALAALERPRQRILMADAVGLGKTIEVGILLAELIKRGKGRRILVVCGRSMMGQLQKETLEHIFAMRAVLRPDQAARFDAAVVKALTAKER